MNTCEVFSAFTRAQPRHSLARRGVISLAILVFAPTEPKRRDSVASHWNRKSELLIAMT